MWSTEVEEGCNSISWYRGKTSYDCLISNVMIWYTFSSFFLYESRVALGVIDFPVTDSNICYCMLTYLTRQILTYFSMFNRCNCNHWLQWICSLWEWKIGRELLTLVLDTHLMLIKPFQWKCCPPCNVTYSIVKLLYI